MNLEICHLIKKMLSGNKQNSENYMEYQKEVNGVEVINDVYGEHFSSDIKVNYTVNVFDMCVSQSEKPHEIAKELEVLGEQLLKWSRHFKRFNK